MSGMLHELPKLPEPPQRTPTGWTFDIPRANASVSAPAVCQGCGAALKLLQGGGCCYCLRRAP